MEHTFKYDKRSCQRAEVSIKNYIQRKGSGSKSGEGRRHNSQLGKLGAANGPQNSP